MSRPHALFRLGFPYLKTIGMRRTTNYPVDLAFGTEGKIYVLCLQEISANTGIATITFDDEYLGNIGTLGKGDGQFIWPVSIIVDRQGNIAVSDSALHRITYLTAEGEFIQKWGVHGNSDGQINYPSGIAFDSEENVYVVDSLNHRVQKFTKEGIFIMKWGTHGNKTGEFNMPWGIAVDELDDVYVADWRNDRIQKFTSDGEFVFSLGKSGNAEGEFSRPAGVAVDADGDIYVADTLNNRVQLFSEQGRYVEQFIGDATMSKSMEEYMLPQLTPLMLREQARLEPQKRLRKPRSVQVDADGKMYIPDYETYRVQVYQKQRIPLSEEEIAPPVRSRKLLTI